MRKNISSTTSFLRSIAAGDSAHGNVETQSKSLEEAKTFLCDLIVHTSFPLCLSFQKLLITSANTTHAESDRFNKSLKLIIISLKCVKEWKNCLNWLIDELTRVDSQTLRNEHPESDQVKHLIFSNLKRILFAHNLNVSEKFFSKVNLELLTKYLPKFSVLFDCKTFETASSLDSNSKESYLALIRSFEIFSLYFDIFITKKSESLDEDDLASSCFNILEIDSLEKNLKKIIPKLLLLNESNESTSSALNSIELTMCGKYLKFLIKYLSLKENEQYIDNAYSNGEPDENNLIDMNMKSSSDKENNNEVYCFFN